MDNTGEVGLDDIETSGQEDEKVVTMMDVLKEQEDFEEDANAVLGASDDKNCTYSMGYIKRQAIYACMTCNSDAKDDPAQRAGVCLACSLKCHEDHELVELYTKRNFRCDCGNLKFKSHPCQFTPNKPDLNEGNSYNQNFSGLYCICQRPYPDPDVTEEDEMIQCIICEDWLHSAHLDTTVPDNDQYAEMICKQCMEKNNFLHNYGDLIVNSEVDVLDVSMNGISNSDTNERINIIDSTNDLSINKTEHLHESNTLQNKDTSLELVNDDTNKKDDLEINTLTKEKDNENKLEHMDTNKPDDLTNASQDQVQTSLVNKVKSSAKAESKENSNNCLSPEHSSIVKQEQQHEEVKSVNNIQNENITGTDSNINIEPSELPLNKVITEEENSTELNENEAIKKSILINVNNLESTISSTENSMYCTLQETHINENTGEETNKMDCDPAIGNPHEKKSNEQFGAKEELETDTNMSEKSAENKELSTLELGKDTVEYSEKPASTKSPDELEEDRLLEDPVEPKNVPENNVTQVYSATDETKTEDITSAPVTTDNNIDTSPQLIPEGAELHLEDSGRNAKSDEKMSAIDNNMDELTGLSSADKNDSMSSEKMDVTNDTQLSIITGPMDESGKPEYKRKLSVKDQVDDLESKKQKLDSKPCSKPQNVKQRYIGATFWPAHFRQKLCTCNECLSMYKDLSVLFLIDPEDTVSAYEHLGKAKTNGKPASEYEKGLAALSSLDRVQQINALTEYNKMRDKLLDFLKSFKDRKEVVKEEDIKAFFAGMKPKREPDGVYFCR